MKSVAGVVSLFLGIGIAASQTLVVTAGLAFVVAGFGLVVGGLTKDIMRMFGMV